MSQRRRVILSAVAALVIALVINFDETKQYVRKVMNSYRRYREIYGDAGPQGGIRAEP